VTLSAADLPAGGGGSGKRKKGSKAQRRARRVFAPEYKLAIVEEYDRLTEPGARGALLRREGLYHSHIVDWRAARDAGALNALAAKPTGPKPVKSDAERRAEKLEAENARLIEELVRKDKALRILGKASELLEMLSGSVDSEPRQPK
jgi:transposase-like protein